MGTLWDYFNTHPNTPNQQTDKMSAFTEKLTLADQLTKCFD